MPAPTRVELSTVERGDLVLEIVEDGRVEVIDRYVVSAPLTGNLARSTLRPGDPVEPGKTVVQLLPAEAPLLDARTRAEAAARSSAAADARTMAKANLEAAEVARSQALRERDRLRRMGTGVAGVEVERAAVELRLREEQSTSARFAVEVAQHEAELARAVLGRTRGRDADEVFAVAAPAGGQVLRVFQESAGVVAAGTPLLEVGDPRLAEVVVDVLSVDAVRIRPDASVRIEGWGGPEALRARVRSVEPAAFTRVSALGVEEQRVNVVVALDAPAPPTLGDGYRVEARIEIDRRDGALVVPEAAVFRRGTETMVFAFDDGRARLVPVTLGLRNGTEAEVVDGLAEGDRVVIHPSDAVDEGVRVRAFRAE
jgi:HlyD family secretion protein